jgi:hypothetical protein
LFSDRGEAGITAYALEIVTDQANLLTNKITAVSISETAADMGEILVTLGGITALDTLNVLAYMPQIANANISDTNAAGSIVWECSPTVTAAGTGVSANTTILAKYLPASCR